MTDVAVAAAAFRVLDAAGVMPRLGGCRGNRPATPGLPDRASQPGMLRGGGVRPGEVAACAADPVATLALAFRP